MFKITINTITPKQINVIRQKFFHQSIPRLASNYAIIIGGGRQGRILFDRFSEPLSETSELLNCIKTYEALTQCKQFKPGDIKLLFGNGIYPHSVHESVIKTRYYRSIFLSLLARYFGDPIYVSSTLSECDKFKQTYKYAYVFIKSPPKLLYFKKNKPMFEILIKDLGLFNKLVNELGDVDPTTPIHKQYCSQGAQTSIFQQFLDLIITNQSERSERFPQFSPYYIHPVASLPTIGSATFQNIKTAFQEVASKANKDDNIYIFLAGHGGRFQGMVLWNDCEQWSLPLGNVLTIPMLKEIFDQNKNEARIIVFVNSCYSGIYNLLSNKKTHFYTTGNLHYVSYDSTLTVGKYTSQTVKYFLDDKSHNLIQQHAIGSLESESFYPSDSLSFFLNNQLKDSLYPITNNIFKKFFRFKSSIYYKNPIHGPRITYAINALLITLVAIDPTGVIKHFFNAKFSVLLAKMGLTTFKTLLAVLASTAYHKFRDAIIQTTYYKEKPVWFDKFLIRKIEKNILSFLESKPNLLNKTLLYLTNNKKRLLFILTRLKEISDMPLTEPVNSHYNLLLKKAVLYLLDAIINERELREIDDFIEMAYSMLLPFQQNKDIEIYSILNFVPVPLREIILCSVNEQKPLHCFSILSQTKNCDDRFLVFFMTLLFEAETLQNTSLMYSKTIKNLIKYGLFSTSHSDGGVGDKMIKTKDSNFLNRMF